MNTETFPDPRRAAEERRERYAEQQEQRSLEVAAEQERWLQSARQAAALERIADALEKLGGCVTTWGWTEDPAIRIDDGTLR
jgi:hypothetical protein